MILVALGLVLALGVLIGASGMKRLGRMITGPWRPGAALLALGALALGLILVVRGPQLEGALLLAAGLGLSLLARKRPAAAAPQPGMDRRQAASILGVEADAAPAQIDEAYKRLIRRVHPDTGGAPGLAAQLNAARAALARPSAKPRRGTGRGAEPPRAQSPQ